MNRQELISEAREILAKTGFYISESNDSRMICFDLVARRDNLLIILKFLSNVDSFSKKNANQLSVLSDMFKGSPLIIGEHNSQKKIESGIVYFRHGIPLVNFKTLKDFFVEGFPPLIFSAPGGYYVDIDGDLLQRIREKRNISLGSLADNAGVSRKAIQMYEKGMSSVLEVAIRLEDYLDIPLIRPLNPFEFEPRLETETQQIDLNNLSEIEFEIFTQLQGLGYNVVPTDHCPFEALTKDNKTLIITGISKKDKTTIEKARIIHNISKITEKYSVIFLEKEYRKSNLEGTPVIHKKELNKIADSEEIITLISERSSNH
jgi:putative transcriptional regulator